MKKISAYVGDCIPEDIDIIVDDFLNQRGNGELAVNLNFDDCLLNFFRETKEDGSIEYVIINVDKNSKKVTRYEAKETNQTIISSKFLDGLGKVFSLAEAE